MSLTTLSLEDLYGEISDLARDQGVNSKEQWDELIDDVIEDHLDLGELDLDQDTEGMKDALSGKWTTYKEESLSEEDAEKIVEDVSSDKDTELEKDLATSFYDSEEEA